MKRHWKVLTVWIVITLAVAALIGSLEAFKYCIHEHKDHEAYRAIYEDNSVFVKAIVRLQLHASCGVYAAHKNESPLVAFFTLLIAGFTATLWHATTKIVSGADQNAERQLRAYVGLDMPSSNFKTSPPRDWHVGIKNYGQTPAYHLAGWCRGAVIEPPDVKTFPFPEGENDERSVMSPSEIQTIPIKWDSELSGSELSGVEGGTLTLYIWGKVSYRDAFKKCRWTKFRIHISEEGNFHRRIISSATEGNDAT